LGAGSNSSSANLNRACPPKRPSARRRGQLRHGNPSGDFLASPRCGAQTRAACPCRQPAMANGRCRLHGGKSTGARTESGLARVRANRLVHGARTAEIIDLRSAAARHARTLRSLARLAKAPAQPQSEQSTPCPATSRAMVAAPAKGTTDEHGCAQMNADAMDARQRRAPAPSVFIPSYLRSSVVKPLPASAQISRFERPTPSPATPPANPNGRLVHAEPRRHGLSDAPHLPVSAPPRAIPSSERSTPCPATARSAVAPQRLRMAG
jgi:hypothetical protein